MRRLEQRVLRVDQSGVLAVYSDDLRLSALSGVRLDVRRATHVEYNHDTQQWEAKDHTGLVLAVGSRRSDVVQAEVAVLDDRITSGSAVQDFAALTAHHRSRK